MIIRQYNRNRWMLIALPLFLMLASCSEKIYVSIERYGSEANFKFGMGGLFKRGLEPICLRSLEVREGTSQEVVWKISKIGDKCSLVNNVSLGENVFDFIKQIDLLPLIDDQKYVVSIISDEGSVTSGAW